jgi:hypothetical protein
MVFTVSVGGFSSKITQRDADEGYDGDMVEALKAELDELRSYIENGTYVITISPV